MAQHLSGHLWNASILALAAAIGVAAERLTASAQDPAVPPRDPVGADISSFVGPIDFDSLVPPFRIPVRADPFDRAGSRGIPAVASGRASSTVRTSAGRSRVLTAILVSDDRQVAVIDDEAVRVGDVLPDGARVSAIQPNKVFVVDSKGRWHTLTLTNRGQ
jgi:hypothetical protein